MDSGKLLSSINTRESLKGLQITLCGELKEVVHHKASGINRSKGSAESLIDMARKIRSSIPPREPRPLACPRYIPVLETHKAMVSQRVRG